MEGRGNKLIVLRVYILRCRIQNTSIWGTDLLLRI